MEDGVAGAGTTGSASTVVSDRPAAPSLLHVGFSAGYVALAKCRGRNVPGLSNTGSVAGSSTSITKTNTAGDEEDRGETAAALKIVSAARSIASNQANSSAMASTLSGEGSDPALLVALSDLSGVVQWYRAAMGEVQ